MPNDTKTDVSNNFISRLFSAEFVIFFVGMVFAGGVAWSSIEAEVKDLNKRVDNQTAKQERLNTAVNSIQTDIHVIRNDQRHTKESVVELKQEMRSIRLLLEQRGRDND